MDLLLAEGTLFATRYRVIRPIAIGAMGAVYEVEHVQTRRHLALKMMLPHIVASPKMRTRFVREAQVAADIESDHIVMVLDASVDEATDTPFIVMELLRGEPLSKALARAGHFDARSVVGYVRQVARALEKTHRALIVHRDLKPENLFLTLREGGETRIKILDFGIAKIIAEGEVKPERTRNVGTPLYMAPEQLASEVPISPATDIHALGMIAFTLLVGTPYWTAQSHASGNLYTFVCSIQNGPQVPATAQARAYGVELPEDFDPWFRRMTAASPGDRFQSAREAADALAEALGVAETVAPPVLGVPTGSSPSSLPPKPPEEAATTVYSKAGLLFPEPPAFLEQNRTMVIPLPTPQRGPPEVRFGPPPPGLAGADPSPRWGRVLAAALGAFVLTFAILLLVARGRTRRAAPPSVAPTLPAASR